MKTYRMMSPSRDGYGAGRYMGPLVAPNDAQAERRIARLIQEGRLAEGSWPARVAPSTRAIRMFFDR